ncbi:Uncharacterised protein [Pseudomonas luteola]|uniref:Uncharacterized protein n=1 Tax=Pseudomonas luteola TaxID=47886 RepID=A0A2X2DZD6_PSELU|nr:MULTISPECIES: hypothetical protein [Pseudomonas]MBA1250187.1 hypothetical protein [Pseudomonas zeshuii]MBH3440938.1 hypothetical protein [Pseudomonas luteola]SPY99960.1 Uncharacterised protein [Pseudomonas luteola]
MKFRSLAITGALFVCIGSTANAAAVAGIPVYCFNCEQGSYNAASAILDGQRSQTEALLNGMDYVMRTQQKLNVARDTAVAATQEKIKNSYAMEPSLGAKPRSACGQLGAATVRAVAQNSAPALRKILALRTKRHNEVSKSLAPKEPRLDYNVGQVIKVLDDPSINEYGKVVMADEPIDPSSSDLEKKRTLLEMLLNPFPVETPSQDDIDRIKKTGSPGEKKALAESIAVQRRQEVGQYVHDAAFEKNVQRLDASSLKYMLDDLTPYLSDEQKKMLSRKLSPNQLDELLATYRVRSEAWVKQVTTSPSTEMLQREQVLISAEMLNQTWELKKSIGELLKVASFAEVRTVSQNGMQTR